MSKSPHQNIVHFNLVPLITCAQLEVDLNSAQLNNLNEAFYEVFEPFNLIPKPLLK